MSAISPPDLLTTAAANNPSAAPFPLSRVALGPALASLTIVPYLEAEYAEDTVAPSVSTATLLLRCGEVMRENSSVYEVQVPLAFVGQKKFMGIDSVGIPGQQTFVRIDTVTTNGDDPGKWLPLWYGVIPVDERTVHGDQTTLTKKPPVKPPVASLDQTFRAYGLESLFDYVTIDTAWASDGYVEGSPETAYQIQYVPIFNERYERGVQEIGNRSKDQVNVGAGPDATYVFSGDNSLWNALDVLQYLVRRFAPPGIKWAIDGQTLALSLITPIRLDLEGLTLRQAIDQLVDRSQGLGWCIRVNDDAGEPPVITANVHIFTVFDTAVSVTLGDSHISVDPNPEQLTFDATGRVDLQSLQLRTDALRDYGQVIVRGGRVKSCFTLSFADGNLQEGWTVKEAKAYRNGTGGSAPGQVHDEARAAEKFHHVYSAFLVPTAWNWRAGVGEGFNVNPLITDDGKPSVADDGGDDGTSSPVRNWGHTFLHHLPLLKPVELDANNRPILLHPEFRTPVVFVQKPGVESKWTVVDAHSLPNLPTAGVRMLDNDFGFEVSFHPRHLLAKNHFDPTSAGDINTAAAPTDRQPVFDYSSLIATVAVETDARLTVKRTIPHGAANRTLSIEIPHAELWYIDPNAIVDVDPASGGLVRFMDAPGMLSASGGAIRNDADKLQTIADLAVTWYGATRASVSIDARMIIGNTDGDLRVGSILKSVVDSTGSTDIKTPITRKVYDFKAPATRIETTFSELEFQRFFT